jgi:hypothetical protein
MNRQRGRLGLWRGKRRGEKLQPRFDLLVQGHGELDVTPGAGSVGWAGDPAGGTVFTGDFLAGQLAKDDQLRDVPVDDRRVSHGVNLEQRVLAVVQENIQHERFLRAFAEVPVIDRDFHGSPWG